MIDKKTESEIQEGIFINSIFECSEIKNSSFRNSVIQNTNLEGAYLQNTNLEDIDISNIDFTTPEAQKMISELRKQQNK